MKIIAIITLLALLVSCSREPEKESASYRTMRIDREITPDQLGGRNAFSVALTGDTLFVVAFDTSNNSALFLFDYSTGEKLGEIDSWKNDSATFSGHPTCVTADNEYIYVGETDSRMDVFDRSTLRHVTTVGSGVWWGEDSIKMVHSFGVAAIDSLLFVRDKSTLRVFAKSTITPALEWKVPLFAKSAPMSTNTAHHGIVSANDAVFVTDYNNQCIYKFERSSFAKHDTSVAPSDTISLGFNPRGLALHGTDELLVTGRYGRVDSRSVIDGSLNRTYKSFEGHIFEEPSAIAVEGDNLAIVEETAGTVQLGTIGYSSISIY